MVNFSICLIAKDEAKTIPRMVGSLKEFMARGGEIILVDTGSTDGTVQIARGLGCKVTEAGERFVKAIDRELAEKINERFLIPGEEIIVRGWDRYFDFSEARNFAASLASNDMISNQDCDETYTRLDIDKIEALIKEGYEQFEYNFVFSRDQFGNEAMKFIQCKFYNRKKQRWTGCVHECLQGEAKRMFLDESIIKLDHWQNNDTVRHSYLKGLAVDCFLHPKNDRNSHYFARELFWNKRPRSAIKEFERHITMNGWHAEKAQSAIFIGDAYGVLNQPEKQVEWYNKAFFTDCSRREPLIKLARFYQWNKNPLSALCYAQAATQIGWQAFYANVRAHYTNEPHEIMYWAKGWLGDVKGAQEELLKAMAFQPYNPMYQRDTKYYFEYADPGIQGWMTYPEMLWLYETAKQMTSVAEIGSWKGRSTHALCTGCEYPVTAVDHFMGSAGEEEAHKEAQGDAIYNQFLTNMKGFTNLTVNRKASLDAVQDYPDKAFDMVFIDGEHTYEGVKADIRAWRSKARILLCGHDYCDAWPNLKKAVDEEMGAVKVCESIWYKLVNTPKVSIVIPTLGRAEKLQRCLKAIHDNAGYDNYEIIVEEDSFADRQGAPKTLKKGADRSTGELVMFLGNDTIPQPNFLFNAVIAMYQNFPEADGLIGLNDMYWHGEFCTHFLASKKLLPMLGGGEFLHCGYFHTACDNELTERCRQIGKYVWAENAKVYHDHPAQTRWASTDAVYEIAYAKEGLEHDQKLLEERSKLLGFPIKHAGWLKERLYPTISPGIDLRAKFKEWRIKPRILTALNVGVGSGDSLIAKQLPFAKFKQLDNLDVHEPYLLQAKEGQWDAEKVNFAVGDIRGLDTDKYDVVMMFDVLEHLPKEDALEVLDRIKGKQIIFIPIEKNGFRENTTGVKSQEHLSYWKEQDFKDKGFTTELIKDFHLNNGVAVSDALWAVKL